MKAKFLIFGVLLSILLTSAYLNFGNLEGLFLLDQSELKELYPRFFVFIYYVLKILPCLSILSVIILIILFILKLKGRKRVFVFIIGIVSFVVFEMGLRLANFRPGMVQSSRWFTPTSDTLVLDGFVNSEEGIFKFDTAFKNQFTLPSYNQNLDGEVIGLFERAKAMKKTEGFLNYAKKNSQEMDSLVNVFLSNPINEEGFFSVPFVQANQGKKSILLLGDSFTFGHNSSPGKSFSDLLLLEGFLVYNTGVSGADPLQYLLIAEKYIPQLKPDFVVLNFFMGNDIMRYEREYGEDKPLMYNTRTNRLYSNIYGQFRESAHDVIKHIIFEFGIPPTSFINKVFASTAATSLAWRAMGMRYLQDKETVERFKEIKEMAVGNLKEWTYTQEILFQIKKIAEGNGSQFVLMVIPEVKNLRLESVENYGFEWGNDYQLPENLSAKDYIFNNGHYNDSGHKKHFEAILKNLKKQ